MRVATDPEAAIFYNENTGVDEAVVLRLNDIVGDWVGNR
jgi:hypothetical protein